MSKLHNDKPVRSTSARWFRIGAFAVLLIALAIAANRLGSYLVSVVQLEILVLNEHYQHYLILGTILIMVVYSMLLAIPFVPGVEIGFGMIIMFGTPLVIPVFVSTVTGVSLAFVLGRIIPQNRLQGILRFFYMDNAADLIDRLAPLSVSEKLDLLTSAAPRRFVPFLLRHRFLAVAAALNIPGNAVIGGGGGIGMLAGLSRLFPFPLFLLTVILAASPIPVFILVFGPGILGR